MANPLDDVITTKALYGEHIALYCANHPELRWSTKNIDQIGARTIFYNSQDKPECSCSPRLLRVLLDRID
jgi:hypothetical protein